MAKKTVVLEKKSGESEPDYAVRMREEAEAAHEEAEAARASIRTARVLAGIAGVLALFLLVVAAFALLGNSSDLHIANTELKRQAEEVNKLKGQNTTLAAQLKAAQDKKPEPIPPGATPDQVKTAIAEAFKDAKCVRPASTGGPRTRGFVANSGQSTATASASASGSATATASASAGPSLQMATTKPGADSSLVVGKKPLDRCIFRIKGEIKAETFVENGEVNCPTWRDSQLARYNQNPHDLIWSKKYPSAKPE